uniref:SsDNA binding protein n=1 Tax=Pseudomonas phage Arace01 TaxID=3138526 RepID=A0AAU6VZC8_9VIRU
MSNLFGNLKSDGLEESKDRLGGGGGPRESDIYTGKIKYAYAGKSEGGALSVTVAFTDGEGRDYRETLWVTNKNGENFFLNKQDNTKKVPLPGFTIVEDICLIVTGKPLAEQDIEEKVFNIYDFDAGKEIPKSVDALVELTGQEISFGIMKVLENKSVKDDNTGKYEPTAEEVERNNIDKVFHTETKMTVAEARNGQEEGGFWDKWVEKNKGEGKFKDNRKYKAGAAGKAGKPAAAGAPKASAPAAAAGTPKKLFGNK